MSRKKALSLLLTAACVIHGACRPVSEPKAQTAANATATSSTEPAPLPPAEMPPPDAAPAATPPPARVAEPGVAPTGAPTRGTLPKAVIDEKLKSVGPAIQACYERGLKTSPELHGSVTINFVVAPDGKVAHADTTDGDDALSDPTTVDCILAEIGKLEFPPPRGGRVFIAYPLKLEPPRPAPVP